MRVNRGLFFQPAAPLLLSVLVALHPSAMLASSVAPRLARAAAAFAPLRAAPLPFAKTLRVPGILAAAGLGGFGRPVDAFAPAAPRGARMMAGWGGGSSASKNSGGGGGRRSEGGGRGGGGGGGGRGDGGGGGEWGGRVKRSFPESDNAQWDADAGGGGGGRVRSSYEDGDRGGYDDAPRREGRQGSGGGGERDWRSGRSERGGESREGEVEECVCS